MSDLYETLVLLRVRPENLIGSKSVDSLFVFLQGWRSHRNLVPDADAFADAFFEDFHAFVESQLGRNRSAKGWAKLISESATEVTALNLFLELLEKFYQRHIDLVVREKG